MPDKRRHRGAHPDDDELFGDLATSALRAAAVDYWLLLDRGYPRDASLKLVGDRFDLRQRQRMALARSSCTRQQVEGRTQREVPVDSLSGAALAIDGFNLLITIEAALSGAVVLPGRDGACRDIASQHGTFRTVEETGPALEMIGEHLLLAGVGNVLWLLDRPVSNSGKLRGRILGIAEERGWDWEVELVQDPDAVLKRTTRVVVTGDSVILDHCETWTNLAWAIIGKTIPEAWIVDLRRGPG